MRETRPDDIGVSVSYPLPGTVFFERVHGQLGAKTHWEDSEDLTMMFKGAYKSEFYRALHDALHAEVESWTSRLRENSASGDGLMNRETVPVHRRFHWTNSGPAFGRLEETSRNADATEIAEWTCS